VDARPYPQLRDTRDFAAFFLNLGRTGGPVVEFRDRGRPAFLANHPEHARHVLATHERNYRNPHHPYAELAGACAPAGSFLLRLRRGRAARTAALGEIGAALAEAAAHAAGEAVRAGTVEVDGLLKRAVFRAMTRLTFGVDPGALGDAFVPAIGFIEECWANELFTEGTPGDARLEAAYAAALAVQHHAAEWIGRRAGMAPGPQGRTAVVRTLLNAYNATATATSWTLHHLAARRGMQDGLARQAAGTAAAGATETAARLPLLRAAVLEALRLNPPAWNLARQAIGADRLGDVAIPPGAAVFVSPYAMHRHPGFWESPGEFRPGRFVGARPPAPFAFVPFGGGTRRCPAAATSPAHVVLLAAELLRRCRWVPAGAEPVRPRGLVALRPEPGLWLAFEPREPRPPGDSGWAADDGDASADFTSLETPRCPRGRQS
jgi:hypothetical protein